MAAWRELYFTKGAFIPDVTKTAAWNRGSHLVEGLGHCSDCHTPQNLLGGLEKSNDFPGAVIDGWLRSISRRTSPRGLSRRTQPGSAVRRFFSTTAAAATRLPAAGSPTCFRRWPATASSSPSIPTTSSRSSTADAFATRSTLAAYQEKPMLRRASPRTRATRRHTPSHQPPSWISSQS
jgi:hypothetical protein